ncbi:MAG: YbbR-like domain-containing protein [Bryobacteraceae bacterium]
MRALRFVFTDFWWKLVALSIAVILWGLVASEPELSSFVLVPVEYKDLPAGIEISSDVVESVYLEVRGPYGELRAGPQASRYAVVLDMSRVRPGEQTFSIRPGDVRLPRGIRLLRAIPSQIRLDFEPRAYRTVPVRVRFAPAPRADYEVSGYTVTPPALRIVGPQSRVNGVDAVVTDPIDTARLEGSRDYIVNTFLGDPQVRFAGDSQVKVSVQMKRK